jgi:hypothetical protein
MTDDTRIDLFPLGVDADPARLERSARAIAARVAPSLRSRRGRAPSPWVQLAVWRRPIFAGAGLVAAASIAVLVMPRPRSVAVESAAPATLAEAAGVPVAVAGWVEGATSLSNDVLIDVQEMP